jgi:hypothetical protein
MKEIEDALNQRDSADYRCFQLLDRILLEIPANRLIIFLTESTMFSSEEAQELLHECDQAVQQRKEANIRFLTVLSGKH